MANTVAVMVEYMDVLTEKYNLLHHQLLEARILVDKNHIVIQRDKLPADKVYVDVKVAGRRIGATFLAQQYDRFAVQHKN